MLPAFFKKKKEEKKETNDNKFENSIIINQNADSDDIKEKSQEFIKDEKTVVNFEETKDIQKRVKLKTIVIEQEQENNKTLSNSEKEESLKIPLNIKEEIERIILKTLYDEKSVKSLKILIDKVLEGAVEKKITISEKNINSVIYQMEKDKKIEFTQKDGWKIKI